MPIVSRAKMALIKRKIMRHETETTYEWADAKIVFGSNLPDTNMWRLDRIIRAIKERQSLKIGAYQTEEYFLFKDEIEEMTKHFSEKGIESRQYVIQFPVMHCFQSVQFLVRGEVLHVITNMRSCNFEVNFATDTWLSYYFGAMFADEVEKATGLQIARIRLVMQIGSLHIFKKEGGQDVV